MSPNINPKEQGHHKDDKVGTMGTKAVKSLEDEAKRQANGLAETNKALVELNKKLVLLNGALVS